MGRTIVVLSDAGLFQTVSDGARQGGFNAHFASDAERVDAVAFLAALQPALIIIGLNAPPNDWERFVLAAKTSPATRKIPILALGPATAELLQRAQLVGADAVVNEVAAVPALAAQFERHARPDDSGALAAAAREPLPELARAAIAQFNAGEFFEQHETFETLWRAEPGPIRQLYQGILQVGVAYLQIQRGHYDGARKIFQRAWQYLAVLPDVCRGIDIARLRADAQAAQAELERLGPERIAEFPAALLRPLTMAE